MPGYRKPWWLPGYDGYLYDPAMTATKDDVLAVLRTIDDPELKRDVVTLNGWM